MLHKAVMLLGRSLGKGLEPVGAMGGAQLHGPLLHALGHDVSSCQIQRLSVIHYVAHLLINLGGKILVHLFAVENILAKEFAWAFCTVRDGNGFLIESSSYYLKSECT